MAGSPADRERDGYTDTEYSNFQVQTIVPNILNSFISHQYTEGCEAAESILEDGGANRRKPACHAGLCLHGCPGRHLPCRTVLQRSNLARHLHGQPPHFKIWRARSCRKHRKTRSMRPSITSMECPACRSTVTSVSARSGRAWRTLRSPRIPGRCSPAYGITNLNMQLTPQQYKHFSVSLFCNNLFDKHYAANLSNVRGQLEIPHGSGHGHTHKSCRGTTIATSEFASPSRASRYTACRGCRPISIGRSASHAHIAKRRVYSLRLTLAFLRALSIAIGFRRFRADRRSPRPRCSRMAFLAALWIMLAQGRQNAPMLADARLHAGAARSVQHVRAQGRLLAHVPKILDHRPLWPNCAWPAQWRR